MGIDDSQWMSLDVRWLNATVELSGRFNINFSALFRACNSNRQHHLTARIIGRERTAATLVPIHFTTILYGTFLYT
jgi:hypothetical protein